MAETSNDTGGGSKRGRGAYYGANIEKELATKKVSLLKVELMHKLEKLFKRTTSGSTIPWLVICVTPYPQLH